MSTLRVLRAAEDPPASRRPTSRLVLDLVRLRARRLAARMARLWEAGQSSPDQGLAITAGEVARLLDGEAAHEAARFAHGDGHAAAQPVEIAAAEAALAADPLWARLTESFGLGEAEADLLAAAAAVEIDPDLRRVFAYLHDDARLTTPTGLLAARLADRPPASTSARGLIRWRLAEPVDEGSPHRLTTAWQADPALAPFLAGAPWSDPRIADGVTLIEADDARRLPCLHPDALAALRAVADVRQAELVGPSGIGRQTLAAQFAAGRDQGLLAADLALLAALGLEAREAIVRVLRQARALDALAYFRESEIATGADWVLAGRLETPFLRGLIKGSGAPERIALAPLSSERRGALWRGLAPGAPAPSALATHRLTPAEIAGLAGSGAGRAAGRAPRGGRTEDGLMSALPLPYDWDDLVLPPATHEHLRAFEDQIRHRWAVLEDWGFSRLAHLGAGIAALFAGASGTGKTMAAQVIARSLGLDLWRVDLAGVVNKYVGETEKKLREVFDACEHAGALLFFDEADALFGGRMQAKDAHDRFANIEINYLLQRIESFDGVAILATNRRGDIDQAFIRRLRFVVEFLPPRPTERLSLWRRALPPHSPAGERIVGEVDFAVLAERLQMTGAEIKNTALAAAHLARARGSAIGMAHIMTAAERELAKAGNRLRLGGEGKFP